MQTKSAKRPYLNNNAAGDQIDADWNDVTGAGYLPIAELHPTDTMSLLETWDCPKCNRGWNWARIVLRKGRIEVVEAVELSAETILAADYISDQRRFLIEAATTDDRIVEALVEQLNRGSSR